MSSEIPTGENDFPEVALRVLKDQSQEAVAEYIKATQSLLRDRPTNPVDAVFFFGRSWGDAKKEELFRLAVDYIKTDMARYIIIPGTEGETYGGNIPQVANPGMTLWTSRLVGMGVPSDRIIPSDKGYNTKAEGDAFLVKCKEEGWTSGVAIANEHQILRATLGLCKTINDEDLQFNIYSDASRTNNWHGLVRGSQGAELKPRSAHILDEFMRGQKYQEKGDLASYEKLYSYLERRGSN